MLRGISEVATQKYQHSSKNFQRESFVLMQEAAFKITILKKTKLTNLCRISDFLLKSSIFADFRGQKAEAYLGSSETSKMERKYFKPLTISAKGRSWMYDWVLNTPLEGFVQDVTRKELAIGPVVEGCITNKLASNSTTNILRKNQKLSLTFF